MSAFSRRGFRGRTAGTVARRRAPLKIAVALAVRFYVIARGVPRPAQDRGGPTRPLLRDRARVLGRALGVDELAGKLVALDGEVHEADRRALIVDGLAAFNGGRAATRA